MENMLQPTDLVGVTFWLISIAMVAATVFFFSRTRPCRRKMEDVSNGRRSRHADSSGTLFLHARGMGRFRR